MPNRLFCGCCNACDKRTHTFASDGSGLANWHLIDADAGAITAAQTNGEIREGVTVLSKNGLLPNANRYVYDLALDGRERLSFPLKMRLISQASVTESETYGYGLGDHVFGEVEILNDTNDVDDFKWTFRLSIGKVVSGVETILDTTFWPVTKTGGNIGLDFATNHDIVLRLCRSTQAGYDSDVEILSFKLGYITDSNYDEYDISAVFTTQPDHLVSGNAASETPTGIHVGYQLIVDSDTQDEPRVKQAITQRSQTDELTSCPVCALDTWPCPCLLEDEKAIWSQAESDISTVTPSGYEFHNGPTTWFSTRYAGFDNSTLSTPTGFIQPIALCRTLHVRLVQYKFLTTRFGGPRYVYHRVVEWCDILVRIEEIDRVAVMTRAGIYNSTNPALAPTVAYDLQAEIDEYDPSSFFGSPQQFPSDIENDPESLRGWAISDLQIMRMDRSLWDCGNFSIDIPIAYPGVVAAESSSVSGTAFLGKTATISNL